MAKAVSRFRVFPQLVRLILKNWQIFGVGILGLFLGAGVNMLLPDIGRRLLDKDPIFSGWGLFNIGALFVGLFAVQGIFFYIRSFAFHRLSIQVAGQLRQKLFESLLGRPISFFDSVLSGDLLSRVTSDIALVQSLLGIHLSVLMRYGAQILIGLVLMLLASPVLSIYVLLIVPVLVLPSVGLIGRLRRYSKQQQQALGDASALAGEAFTGVRIIKSFNAERRFSDLFNLIQKEIAGVSTKRAGVSSFFSSFVGFLMNSCLVVLLFLGFQEVSQSGLKPGGLLAFLLYGGIVAVSFAFFSNALSDFVQALGALERVMEYLGTGATSQVVDAKREHARLIRFSNVSFAYKPGLPNILENVSLEIDCSKSVAIVGASGSGKSTLISLLMSWYRASKGEIFIGQQALTEQNSGELLRGFAVVPQDTQLFSVSVQENIEIGGPGAEDVLAEAGLTEVVNGLPEGLKTKLGERGGRLSGGQRQRLALARALAARPSTLVIDEGLSGLDSVTEAAVLGNIRRRCGLIFVTHRLSSIADFDRIIVLDEGQIVGDGRHTQLLQNCQQYKLLVDNSRAADSRPVTA